MGGCRHSASPHRTPHGRAYTPPSLIPKGPPAKTHHLGDGQWAYNRDLLRRAGALPDSHLAPCPGAGGGPGATGGPAQASGGGQEQQGQQEQHQHQHQHQHQQQLWDFIARSREIYDDASAARPSFPGAPDDYRRRQYRVSGSSWEVQVE